MNYNKLRNHPDFSTYVQLSLIFLVAGGLIYYGSLKPQNAHEFKTLEHEYAIGVFIETNVRKRKSANVHVFEFMAYNMEYKGTVGAKFGVQVGDSCAVIYETLDPNSNTIYSYKVDSIYYLKRRIDKDF